MKKKCIPEQNVYGKRFSISYAHIHSYRYWIRSCTGLFRANVFPKRNFAIAFSVIVSLYLAWHATNNTHNVYMCIYYNARSRIRTATTAATTTVHTRYRVNGHTSQAYIYILNRPFFGYLSLRCLLLFPWLLMMWNYFNALARCMQNRKNWNCWTGTEWYEISWQSDDDEDDDGGMRHEVARNFAEAEWGMEETESNRNQTTRLNGTLLCLWMDREWKRVRARIKRSKMSIRSIHTRRE